MLKKILLILILVAIFLIGISVKDNKISYKIDGNEIKLIEE